MSETKKKGSGINFLIDTGWPKHALPELDWDQIEKEIKHFHRQQRYPDLNIWKMLLAVYVTCLGPLLVIYLGKQLI